MKQVQQLLAPDPTPATVNWATRIAVISFGVLVTGLFMHRLFALPTPVALNLVKLSILGGLLALILCAIAAIQIWRTGAQGAAALFVAGLIAGGLVVWPLLHLPTIQRLPEINDITTDPEDPPAFETLAEARPPDANSPVYPGEAFAEKQRAAYPDMQTLWINRSSAEAYEIARDALQRQGLRIVEAVPPGSSTSRPGRIEATDQTLLLGFEDDVVVRVIGNSASARVDLRSASRYGRHDLGTNATRIRRLLKEINARLEATVPTQSGR